MRNKTTLFLILTVITGLVGFAGWSFTGIEAVRILFLIVADLLIISLLARLILTSPKEMRLQRVKK